MGLGIEIRKTTYFIPSVGGGGSGGADGSALSYAFALDEDAEIRLALWRRIGTFAMAFLIAERKCCRILISARFWCNYQLN